MDVQGFLGEGRLGLRLEKGDFLIVQWLRPHAPNAGGLGAVPGWGTRSHILQLRVCMPQLKSPHAAAKTGHSLINIKRKKKEKALRWNQSGKEPRKNVLCCGESRCKGPDVCLEIERRLVRWSWCTQGRVGVA